MVKLDFIYTAGRRFDDFACFDTLYADADSFRKAIYDSANGLKVRQKTS